METTIYLYDIIYSNSKERRSGMKPERIRRIVSACNAEGSFKLEDCFGEVERVDYCTLDKRPYKSFTFHEFDSLGRPEVLRVSYEGVTGNSRLLE